MNKVFFIITLAISSQSFADCENLKSQIEMNICAQESYEKADEKLNQVYQNIMNENEIDEPSKQLLKQAQRNWISFKETQCKLEGDVMARGGSMEALIVSRCLEDLTTKQTQRIKHLISIY